MDNILTQVQGGELSTNALIQLLVMYNDKVVDDYDTAYDQIELRDSEINSLTAINILKDKYIAEGEIRAAEILEKVKITKSENILLKSQLKDYPREVKDNKAKDKRIARLSESSRQYQSRSEKLTKEAREYRATIARKNSEMARLRLTGHKQIDNYSFHLFPSKVIVEENGEKNDRVNLIVMDENGNMKIIDVNCEGKIIQPKSIEFDFTSKQENFIKGFALVAKQDGWQFTDRVLQLIN